MDPLELHTIQELLKQPSPTGNHEEFLYYGSPFIIPFVGDIIYLTYNINYTKINISQYFIILSIENEYGQSGFGKYGIKYQGVELALIPNQKLLTRASFKIQNTTKIVDIYPKNKKIISEIKIFQPQLYLPLTIYPLSKNHPSLQNLSLSTQQIIILKIAHELLMQTKPPGQHEIISYYKTNIVIPLIGDIIEVDYCNFDKYYFIIIEVQNTSGKNGLKYKGIILAQKGIATGMVPFQLINRESFEIRDHETKITDIYPKDRYQITSIKIFA